MGDIPALIDVADVSQRERQMVYSRGIPLSKQEPKTISAHARPGALPATAITCCTCGGREWSFQN